jgi:5,10-methylenetetrahydrofolate reductase
MTTTLETYYIHSLRNALAYRNDPATGLLNRYDARELVRAIRTERDGTAAQFRETCRRRALAIFNA